MSNALKNVQKMFPGVTEVVDAKRARVIEVEPQDLKQAKVKSHKGCAMAVACKRKLVLDGVIMARSTAYLIKGKKATRYHVPESVSREMVAFDRGADFAAGVYKLIPPDKPLGSRTGYASKNKGTGTPRRSYHVTQKVRAMLGGEVPAEE